MIVSFFPDKFSSEPETVDVSFDELPALLQEIASDDKETAPLWSPAEMVGGKTVGHTRAIHALALDFDHVTPPWDKLAAWTYWAATTHSHTEADPHWRVCVELDEPGDPSTWKNRFKAKMLMHAFEMDSSCCNPNRSFFVPPPGAEWRTNEGRSATMPAVTGAEPVERDDLDENADGLLNDGALVWEAVERMMRMLPPSVAGKGGDDRLFEAACVCRSQFRLTAEATYRALQIFNERCEPPWEDDRLWYKAVQAASDRQHVAGELLPEPVKAALRASAEWQPPPEPPPTPPPTDYSALWAPAIAVVSQVTRVEYMCKELGIRDGRPSLWTADARCGKSTLAASVALASAAGTPLWGQLYIQHGPVCYVAGEDIEGVARTWKRLALAQGIAIPDDLHISNAFPLSGPGTNVEHLRTLLSNHRLVIFDTLRSLSREGGVEENDAKFAEGLYVLDKAGQGTGCSIIVLHHNNKQGKSNGTAALFGAAGNHIELTRSEETFITKGFAAGTRDGLSLPSFQVEANLHACAPPADDPDSAGITLRYSKLVAGEEKVSRNTSGIIKRIIERLHMADRWLARSELASDLGKNDDVTAALRTLRDTGKIGYQLYGKQHMYHWNVKMTPLS